MIRYLVLYKYFLRFSFSKAMEFRIDFFFRFLMDIIYYVVNILFFQVIYLHTPLLAGWTQDQMILFIAGYLLCDGINMTVFSNNVWWFPQLINRGDLDYYLIRPVSPLFFLSLREFAANSLMNLMVAAGFFIYALTQYQSPFTLWDLSFYCFLLLCGVFLQYCIQMLFVLPSFWIQNKRGLLDFFYAIALAGERPDRIYKGFTRILFTYIIPLSLVASYPARFFIEPFNPYLLLHFFSICLIFWILMISIWKKGISSYSSASS